MALLSFGLAVLAAAEPALAKEAADTQQPVMQLGSEARALAGVAPQWAHGARQEPDFWLNMERYARFTLSTGLGMFYSVAKPLVDLLAKPQTAVPLGASRWLQRELVTDAALRAVVGIVLLTKLITWTVNAMLGLDPDIEIIA
jgi:hypothetical protein